MSEPEQPSVRPQILKSDITDRGDMHVLFYQDDTTQERRNLGTVKRNDAAIWVFKAGLNQEFTADDSWQVTCYMTALGYKDAGRVA